MPGAHFLERLLGARSFHVSFACDRVEKDLFKRSSRGQLFDLLLQHDATLVDNHDLVADLRDLGQDMRREYDGALAREAANQFTNFMNLPRIEPDRRLV